MPNTFKSKFEMDCEIPFELDYLMRKGSMKFCGVILQNGEKIGYIPIPTEVRYGKIPFIRYLKTDDGQRLLSNS